MSQTIALGVTGSIAAYKAVELARLLRKAGHQVLPVMTHGGERFVGAVTLSGICGNPVRTSMWDPSFFGEMHIEIASQVDAIVIAPATADMLARLAQGRADDLLSALALCRKSPLYVAPAMHPRMWAHPATQRNVATLQRDGIVVLGPEFGEVASGDHGIGRMMDPEAIVRALQAHDDLRGVTMTVTAGPTYEDLDPVRFLGNRSSGKMGFALAAQARERGALVTLIAGPVALETPPGVSRVDVRSASEMQRAVLAAPADVVIMAAAVADFRAKVVQTEKIKKHDGTPMFELERNPDILADLGKARGAGASRPVLVGFALETGSDESVIAYGRDKLARKGVDLVVANQASEALGGDTNRAHLISTAGVVSLQTASKKDLADAILTEVSKRVAVRP